MSANGSITNSIDLTADTDRDARNAVLLDQDDNVTEDRGWNTFALSGGVLMLTG